MAKTIELMQKCPKYIHWSWYTKYRWTKKSQCNIVL